MKPTKLLPFVALLLVLSTSCSTDSSLEDDINAISVENPPTAKTIEIEILERINAYRIEKGLNPLNNHDIIKAVAYTHTDYMIEKNDVNHDYFFQRKTSLEENASAKKVSENVAYAYSNAESVVNAWIRSEGHRANIEGDYTDFDVSAEQNEQGKWYFTNIFIKR